MNGVKVYQTLAEIARTWAKLGTCSRRQVGAVIADHNGVIISSGYNGAPAGEPHCDHQCICDMDPKEIQACGYHPIDDCPGDQKCTTAIHAEENAILFAARGGRSTFGKMIVTTYGPCLRCARMILQAGIDFVLYLEPNPDPAAVNLFQDHGITFLQSTPRSELL